LDPRYIVAKKGMAHRRHRDPAPKTGAGAGFLQCASECCPLCPGARPASPPASRPAAPTPGLGRHAAAPKGRGGGLHCAPAPTSADLGHHAGAGPGRETAVRTWAGMRARGGAPTMAFCTNGRRQASKARSCSICGQPPLRGRAMRARAPRPGEASACRGQAGLPEAGRGQARTWARPTSGHPAAPASQFATRHGAPERRKIGWAVHLTTRPSRNSLAGKAQRSRAIKQAAHLTIPLPRDSRAKRQRAKSLSGMVLRKKKRLTCLFSKNEPHLTILLPGALPAGKTGRRGIVKWDADLTILHAGALPASESHR